MNRQDLTKLEETLCPFKESRDRVLHFEADGVIWYEPQVGDPPREINGYERDANDPNRFYPLWNVCMFRTGCAFRMALCGCINLRMRCSHASRYYQPVEHTDCSQCRVRKES